MQPFRPVSPTSQNHEQQYANPAAGAAFLYRFPGETYTGIVAVSAQIVTSAVVANRYAEAAILDGDSAVITRVASPTAVAASTTRRTYFAADMGGTVTSPSGDEALPFPDTVFPPGFQLRVTANGIDIGDQVSNVKLYVRRVPSGDMGVMTGATPYDS
jgi:hypothetical protein